MVEAGIRPEIFYFVRAADPRLVATHNGTFNLDKIAPFIRREAYRKPHVGRWHRILRPRIEVILTLARLRSSAFCVFNRAGCMKKIA